MAQFMTEEEDILCLWVTDKKLAITIWWLASYCSYNKNYNKILPPLDGLDIRLSSGFDVCDTSDSPVIIMKSLL